MRIALLLDPPVRTIETSAWLTELREQNDVSLVMLPGKDPFVRALENALREEVPGGGTGVVVLARAAVGHIGEQEWSDAGLDNEAPDLSEHTESASLRRGMKHVDRTDDERVSMLSTLADESLAATTEALEEALAVRPRDRRLLERLQAVMEAAGRWREAVDTKVAISQTIEHPRERAGALASAAGMCARRTNDVSRAVALYEAAIAEDPMTAGAFEAIEAVLVRNNDWAGLEGAYVRQLARLAGHNATLTELKLLDKLADVRAQKLGDLSGAIDALDRLVVVRPDDVEMRARLSALLEKTENWEMAVLCLEQMAVFAPNRVGTFRDLHRLSSRLGDIDRSYRACSVLVHLGEADLDELLVYQQFTPETVPRPQGALDARDWQSLFVANHDEAVSRIVNAIAPAAIELKLKELRAGQRLPNLKPEERQDVEKSTLTGVRTIGWVCAVLGLPLPHIHARNQDLPGGIGSASLPPPTLVLGKSLLTGRTVPELSFAIARELACQHLTARLPTFYPTLVELRTLLLAAVAQVVSIQLPPEAQPLAAALRASIDPMQREELEGAVGALHAGDGRLDLERWIRAIEIASCRAGLLVSGDISTASRMLAIDGRVVGGLSAAERVRDLIPFSVSDEYGRLRKKLGIQAGASTA